MKYTLLFLFVLLVFGTKSQTNFVTNTLDSGAGSLRQVIEDANVNDTIKFDTSLINSGSNTILLTSSILINKSIVIKGLYNNFDTLYISGGTTSRIFQVQNTAKLILDSLVLIDGYSNSFGGVAVRFETSDSLLVSNSFFMGNTGNSAGGAIYLTWQGVNNGYCEILNCNFYNNSSTNSGGAVYINNGIYSSKVIVENTTISDNFAQYYGGGINFNTPNCNISIANCLIKNNSSSDRGGGINVNSMNTTFSISNSEIDNNQTLEDGGGIAQVLISGSNNFTTIENCTFTNNQSVDGEGGGAAILTANAQINGCTFFNNSASNGGGLRSGPSNINNCVFDSNTAIGGAGLYSVKPIISNSQFINNEAIVGGGIYLSTSGSGPAQISGSLIQNNLATQSGAGISSDRLYLSNTVISNNTAGTIGGGIEHRVGGNLEMENNCIIENNSAAYGGGIYFKGTYIRIANSEIRSNLADYGGGLLIADVYYNASFVNYSALIENSIFDGNNALFDGGAVLFKCETNFGILKTKVEVKYSTFSNNIAGQDGAGIYNVADNLIIFESSRHATSETILDHSSFYNNIAGRYGGAVFSKALVGSDYSLGLSFISMTHSTIAHNQALAGGGIYAITEETYGGGGSILGKNELIVTNSSIVENEAITNGGGIYTVAYTLGNNFNPKIIKSSIIALNKNYDLWTNNFAMTSLGYNVLSIPIISGSVSTDQLGIDSVQLNLSGLNFNGGLTQTKMPIWPSVAINNGNPTDFSDAQNVAIVGVRDVGAAEYCQVTYGTDIQVACGAFNWINGETYYFDTIVSHVLENAAGCDSIVTLFLTSNNSSYLDVQIACDSFVWMDGNTYTASNNLATFVLPNVANCDSIITLDLTILNSSNSTDIVTACDSFVWIDGNTYTTSNNLATFVLPNAANCDSIITLDLTILNSSNSTDIVTACDSFVWIDGNTYTTSNNLATFVLPNAANCDSIITLELTILNSTTYTDIVTACDSFVWIDGNTYNSSNNSATFILPNSINCDSIIILDLTILNSSSSTDIITACDSIVWIDGETYTTSNNTASYVMTNVNNCDSIITLNLTILNSSNYTDVVMACDSFVWIDGVTYHQSNNSSVFILPNSNNCDSTVSLDLTITNTITNLVVSDSSLYAIQEGADYQWVDCDNNFSPVNNEIGQLFYPQNYGNYAVQMNLDGCSWYSDCYEFNFANIENLMDANLIQIFPNPASNYFVIENKGITSEIDVSVLTMEGKIMYSQSSTFDKLHINSELWDSGLYFVVCSYNLNFKVFRIVIAN